ncbi:MAG: energy transducer TonB [Verrucomicrobiota bacterium]|nr:energy transducer TonB [Verrucomicrobiota bacterium]
MILKKDGKVKEVTIERTSGSERIDAAARIATLEWRLDPAKLKASDTSKGRLVEMEFRRKESDLDIARAVTSQAGQRRSVW